MDRFNNNKENSFGFLREKIFFQYFLQGINYLTKKKNVFQNESWHLISKNDDSLNLVCQLHLSLYNYWISYSSWLTEFLALSLMWNAFSKNILRDKFMNQKKFSETFSNVETVVSNDWYTWELFIFFAMGKTSFRPKIAHLQKLNFLFKRCKENISKYFWRFSKVYF